MRYINLMTPQIIIIIIIEQHPMYGLCVCLCVRRLVCIEHLRNRYEK